MKRNRSIVGSFINNSKTQKTYLGKKVFKIQQSQLPDHNTALLDYMYATTLSFQILVY